MKIFTHVFSHLYLGRKNSATSYFLALAVIFVGLLGATPVLAQKSCNELNIAGSNSRSAICLKNRIINIKNEIKELEKELEKLKRINEPYACIMSIPGPEECAELNQSLNLPNPCAYERKIQCKKMELASIEERVNKKQERPALNVQESKETRKTEKREAAKTRIRTENRRKNSRFRPVFCQNERYDQDARPERYGACLERSLARIKAEDSELKEFLNQSPQAMMAYECPRFRATTNTYRAVQRESRAILRGQQEINHCTLAAKQRFNALTYRLLTNQIRKFSSSNTRNGRKI